MIVESVIKIEVVQLYLYKKKKKKKIEKKKGVILLHKSSDIANEQSCCKQEIWVKKK